MNFNRESSTALSGLAIPAARSHDLVVSESGDEVIVYDQDQHHIHHLNRTAAVVWSLCDGQRGIEELTALAQVELGPAVTTDVVLLAVNELEQIDLLLGEIPDETRVSSQSRRTLLKGLAAVG